MTIYLHAALMEAPPLKRRVKMKAQEGISVWEVLELYKQKYGLSSAVSRVGISVTVNGVRSSFDRELQHGDKVEIFRPMLRG